MWAVRLRSSICSHFITIKVVCESYCRIWWFFIFSLLSNNFREKEGWNGNRFRTQENISFKMLLTDPSSLHSPRAKLPIPNYAMMTSLSSIISLTINIFEILSATCYINEHNESNETMGFTKNKATELHGCILKLFWEGVPKCRKVDLENFTPEYT